MIRLCFIYWSFGCVVMIYPSGRLVSAPFFGMPLCCLFLQTAFHWSIKRPLLFSYHPEPIYLQQGQDFIAKTNNHLIETLDCFRSAFSFPLSKDLRILQGVAEAVTAYCIRAELCVTRCPPPPAVFWKHCKIMHIPLIQREVVAIIAFCKKENKQTGKKKGKKSI